MLLNLDIAAGLRTILLLVLLRGLMLLLWCLALLLPDLPLLRVGFLCAVDSRFGTAIAPVVTAVTIAALALLNIVVRFLRCGGDDRGQHRCRDHHASD